MKPVSPPPLRIVVVEDDQALLGALAFALELEGYEVGGFGSAEAALDGDLSGACFIIDYLLPDSSGLELLQRLRSEGHTIPAILITSHPAALVRSIAASLDAVVVEKPLLSDDLVEAVRRLTRTSVDFAAA